jgi:dihydroneopterin aldolase
MLASVVDQKELRLALEAGADIIDLKSPQHGALGALPLETISNLVLACAGRRPVSATVGDLPADPEQLTRAIKRTAACGVDYVKVGFFTKDNLAVCLKAIANLRMRQRLVAVLFADRHPPLADLQAFAAAGFRGVMLDTAGKGSGGLLNHIDREQLKDFIAAARSLDLLNGLAGSLQLDDIPRLLPLMPDYLGFRGALCEQGKRTAGIAPQRLNEIRDALPFSDAANDHQTCSKEVGFGD